MKLFVLFLATTAFAGFANAQNKVVVIPLGSDTYQLSLESVELFSWYGELTQLNVDEVIAEVPENKTLVITRAILPQTSGTETQFEIYEGSEKKTRLVVPRGSVTGLSMVNESFGSGIPFKAGSTLKMRRLSAPSNTTYVTLIGHYSSN